MSPPWKKKKTTGCPLNGRANTFRRKGKRGRAVAPEPRARGRLRRENRIGEGVGLLKPFSSTLFVERQELSVDEE